MYDISATTYLSTAACVIALSGCYGASMAGGAYDTLPPMAGVSGSEGDGSASAAADGEPVDFVISSGEEARCSKVNDTFKGRAETMLRQAVAAGFGGFPMVMQSLPDGISRSFLSQESICHALTTPPGVTASNFRQLLEEYKGGSLSSEEAYQRGMVTARIPVNFQCPANFDWANSESYNGVHNCEEVTAQVGTGIPVAMYAVRVPAQAVQSYLAQPKISPYFTPYANGGPTPCGSGPGYKDSYRSIRILPIWNLNFVLRSMETPGSGWTGWMLRRSCIADDGTRYDADDLMFAFGMRTYLPLIVETDGRRAAYTIIIGAAIGASNNPFAGLISESTRIDRFNANEFGQLVTVWAGFNGWGSRKTAEGSSR